MPQNEQTGEWNPRFVNYARVHQRTPEDQLELDRERWPGGSMCGFTFWNQARHDEFAKTNPDAYMIGGSGRPAIIDHEAYDAWLSQLAPGHGVNDAAPNPTTS